MAKLPITGNPTAPQNTPVAQPVYRPKRIERQGGVNAVSTQRWPVVRGGVCDFCGVLDPSLPSTEQYKLCPHFRDIGQLACSYCDASKDPNEVIYHSRINVAGHPADPNTLVVWCDSYNCSKAHEARFKVSQ